jgi:hypothetical protein
MLVNFYNGVAGVSLMEEAQTKKAMVADKAKISSAAKVC